MQRFPADGLGQCEAGVQADGHIQCVLSQRVVQVERLIHRHMDLHVGVSGEKLAQDVGQDAMQYGIEGPEPQLPLVLVGGHPIAQRVALLHELTGLFEQTLTCRRGAYLAAMAHQQRGSQFLFERAHLLGDG
ncbi:hypothetical protein SDC9_154154 [bioreactor metagenome]|uniref:Uncharacterized protein n=1 Tax=bioreactor metagenome TaxID=1076179 RepID=A0A645EYA1_9ZZZZ